MYERLCTARLLELARRFPAVAILGARQVGKTTLARRVFGGLRYLDLEDPRTAQRFRDDARLALDALPGGAVLDEAQAVPEVFAALRGAIDADRRRHGRYIVLGSAQPALVRGLSESLGGRIAAVELEPLTACEAATGERPADWRRLWLRGGFPDALGGDFREWWEAYLRTLLERDLPQYGVAADPLFMRRLLTMLAHQHGGLFNASALGASLGVSYHTVQRHVDVLESVFLVRRLPPYFRNVGKRLTKAPKLFLRDTGLLHHLLNIGSAEELDAHPTRGASWEGFVTEDILRRERIARPGSQGYFWRTQAGAEIDLLLDRGDARVAIEIKAGRGGAPRTLRVLREALPDVGAQRAWIVDQAPGTELLAPGIARIGFAEASAGTP
ncbi:MAG TPA: ATP-binding protein [Burkholderiales bacterium]|nr:ATP-binding protein [Burkholderiales bacterium]